MHGRASATGDQPDREEEAGTRQVELFKCAQSPATAEQLSAGRQDFAARYSLAQRLRRGTGSILPVTVAHEGRDIQVFGVEGAWLELLRRRLAGLRCCTDLTVGFRAVPDLAGRGLNIAAHGGIPPVRSKPVAITVMRISSFMFGSITAPKIRLTSG